MIHFLLQIGPLGELNVLILAFIIVFGLKNAYLLYIRKPHEQLTKLGRSINKMLFWGAIIVILGFIGTFLGLQIALKSQMGPRTDIRLLFGGILVLLKLVIFSLTSFTVISVVWYLFTCQHRKLLESSMKEKYSSD